ncbi:MAG: glycine zipper 2TM domain-containing protein [Burkholderiales bacterium]|nr:glycine zipper 2TM domain-containing protein [Burkholderiales bacterium]
MKIQTKFAVSVFTFAVSFIAQAADFEDYARVISVTPQVEQVNRPRQQCWMEQAQVQPRQQQRGSGGAILGGLAGGLIGSQVGGGNGRLAATAVGAMAGAMVGDRVENDNVAVASEQPVRRCQTVDHWETRSNGYAVTYEYRGHTYNTVVPYDPGNRMPVRVSVTPRM